VDLLIALTAAELARQRPLLEARGAAGFARRCHGDLHLANILIEDGAPVLFDCIEFNDLLSDLDIQYDLAFLLMDLDFRGRRDAGVRVLSAYLDAAARDFGDLLWDGLAALPLMLSVRAGVRTHVTAHGGEVETARAYLEAAIAHLSPAPPVLAAVGGFSGTGKTTFARAVAPGLGASPGAVVLRTDEARKRLAGAGPVDRLARETYTAEFYARVYDELFATARRWCWTPPSPSWACGRGPRPWPPSAARRSVAPGWRRRPTCWKPGSAAGSAMRRTPPSRCCATRSRGMRARRSAGRLWMRHGRPTTRRRDGWPRSLNGGEGRVASERR
jgi:hypothetical protein